SLPLRRSIRATTFVFTDLERLTAAQCAAAEQFATRIESSGGRVLNRPARVLRRFELLRALHEAGRNPFNAYRIDGARVPCRFPVFLRDESRHDGPLTPLLHNHDELAAALSRLPQSGAGLLAVEYCETGAADGLYRKYAAMRVADRLIPRHVLFSAQWVDKTPDVVTDAGIAEERAFLHAFPHAVDARAAFELSGIDYGRIDYSCDANGRVITWEINTNPVIVPLPEKCDVRRLEGQGQSARQISDALRETEGPADVTVSLAKLPPIVDDAGRGSLARVALSASAGMWRALSRLPLGGQAVRALKQSLDLAAQHA
ncbi:MAG: hypothetical protein M3478_02740, partial [Planctomycetota bacterium]|nr:hypothetical protein [Planctomycetota bacterium]